MREAGKAVHVRENDRPRTTPDSRGDLSRAHPTVASLPVGDEAELPVGQPAAAQLLVGHRTSLVQEGIHGCGPRHIAAECHFLVRTNTVRVVARTQKEGRVAGRGAHEVLCEKIHKVRRR